MKRIIFATFLAFFILFNLNFVKSQVPVDGTEWKKVENFWPKNNSSLNDEFYFIEKEGPKEDFNWTINQKYIDDLDVKENRTLKLSFKFWSRNSKWGNSVTAILNWDKFVIGIATDYSLNYKPFADALWMPIEVIATKAQIKSLYFYLRAGGSLTAIKDLKVEYEKEIEKKSNSDLKSSEEFSAIGVASSQTFPDDCYLDPLNMTSFKCSGLKTEQIHTDGKKLAIETKSGECIGLTYLAKKYLEINVYYNLELNSTDFDKLLTIKPKITEEDKNVSTNFCLADFLGFKFETAVIYLDISKTNSLAADYFALKITNSSSGSGWKTPVPHLKDMAKFDANEADWNLINGEKAENLEFHDKVITFSARTISEYTANAYLLSNDWIDLEKHSNLFQTPSYSIQVDEEKMFNSFRVTPKICDQQFHCIDSYHVNPSEPINGLKTYEFKFDKVLQTKYIKLVFYIEYYKPPYEANDVPYDVQFKLQLKKFGDPCQSIQCDAKHGKCFIENEVPKCRCKFGYAGVDCSNVDICKQNKTAIDNCVKHACINMKDTFKCDCSGDEINWNKDKMICENLTISSYEWESDVPDNSMLPLKKPIKPKSANNELIFDFKGIDVSKDLCLEITYDANKDVFLEVSYNSDSNSGVRYFLLKNNKTADICVKHLRQYKTEDFQVSLKSENFEKDDFTLKGVKTKFMPSSSQPMKYIEKWTRNSDSFNGKWIIYPKSVRKQDTGSFFVANPIPLKKGEKSSIILMSEWIEANFDDMSQVMETEAFFVINDIDDISIKKWILYQTNGGSAVKTQIKTQLNGDKTEKKQDFKEMKTLIVSGSFVFKIIIEVEMEAKANDKTFNFKIDEMTFGDSCWNTSGSIKVCLNGGECSTSNMTDFTCDCKKANPSDQWAGKTCNITNICTPKPCKNEPSFYGTDSCIQKSDKVYECLCPHKSYKWNGKECERTYQYQYKTEECFGKSCALFEDLFLKETGWANQYFPKLDDESQLTETVPFYYTSDSDKAIKFNIELGKDGTDACFDLTYKIDEKSSLLISYDDKNPLELRKSDPNQEWDKQYICASHLTNAVGKRFNFKVNSKLAGDKTAAIIHYKNNPEIKTEYVSELKYLVNWNNKLIDDPIYKPTKQWTLKIPANEWTVDDRKTFQFNSLYTGQRNSLIMSQWISKKSNDFMFRAKMNLQNPSKMDFSIEYLVFDENLKEISVNKLIINDTNRKDIKRDHPIVVSVPKIDTSFKFVLRISYEAQKLTQPMVLYLQNISLGDPCTNENGGVNTCSGNGTCVPNEKETDGYKCECHDRGSNKYKGKNCELIDACNSIDRSLSPADTGDSYCKKNKWGECQQVGNSFQCPCPTNTYWKKDIKKCSTIPKCLKKGCNITTMLCDEPKTADGEAICKCNKAAGYIPTNKTNGLVCEKFDVCNHDHHLIRDNKNITLCGNGSKCQKTGENDWTCLCETPGYEKVGEHGDTKCMAKPCSNPANNLCQQNCVPDPELKSGRAYTCDCTVNYDKDGDKCKLKDSAKTLCKPDCGSDKYCVAKDQCKCNPGLVEQGDKCELKDVPTTCPTGKLQNNTKLCDCGDNYQFNDKTLMCDLKPICGTGGTGRAVCSAKKALCLINPSMVHYYECKCPSGTIKGLDGNCVDYCDTLINGESRSDICKNLFGSCNAFKKLTHSVRPQDFCECYSGFVWDKSQCVLALHSSSFKLQIRDTFSSNVNVPEPTIDTFSFKADIKGVYKDFESMIQLNKDMLKSTEEYIKIKTVKEKIEPTMDTIMKWGFNPEKIMVDKCVKTNEYYECTFIVVGKGDQNIKDNAVLKNISNLCVKVDDKDCFIDVQNSKFYLQHILYASANPQVLSRIQFNTDSLSKATFATIETCENQPCTGFSNCEQDKDSNLMSCKCNTDDYDVMRHVPLRTSDGNSKNHFIETCKAKDVCKTKCKKEKSTCTFKEKLSDNKWKVELFCKCDNLYRSEVSNGSITQCVEACSGISCSGNGKATAKDNSCHCVCDEAYYGENCQNEHSLSKGGWIAGIVILAVIVVILSGVAFMFAKRKNHTHGVMLSGIRRSRANDDVYSSQSMDEMGGSTYRVPAQGRGQQNSAFRNE